MMLAPVVAAGIAFTCTPVAVFDGDGPIWCAEGPRIRLTAIAAREIDGTCRRNHPCPDSPAEASRDHLADLLGERTGRLATGHVTVRGPALRCVSTGSARGNRTGARCVSPVAGDLSCRMVRDGFAAEWRRYGRACE